MRRLAGLQHNWLVKLVVVTGALVSAGLVFLQLWRILGW
jgi:hypothetical protein